MFAEFFDNKLLLTLTVLYIILGSLAYYFNSKSWMQYKGDEKYSVLEKLDDEDDEKRSTRTRWSSLFIKNKLFFYIVFGSLGFISLLFAWLHRILVGNNKNPTNGIPKNYFNDLFKFILIFFTIIGLFTIIFFLFSYAPTSLVFIINILNILVILGVLAFIFENTRKNQALLATAVIFAAIGGLYGGLSFALFGSIFGALFGYLVGLKNTENNKPNNKSKFIISLINFIPCLFLSLADFIKEQFNLTSNNTLIILFIEIVLISLKFIVSYIFKAINKNSNANKLIKSPVSLHYKTSLGKYVSPKEEKDNNMFEKDYFNYNYALSFWLWIIPQPKSVSEAYNKPTEILNIGNVLKFNYNDNKIDIFASTSKEGKMEASFEKIFTINEINYQKWNNFVINYSGGTLDIFKNSELISSTPNITPISSSKLGSVGEKDGIYGGIKDVVYYKKSLTNQEIDINYKKIKFI
tara:strand:- start:1864 stop:3258 length:1395 start_codon:yes stop_codon:yes gene_type:complete